MDSSEINESSDLLPNEPQDASMLDLEANNEKEQSSTTQRKEPEELSTKNNEPQDVSMLQVNNEEETRFQRRETDLSTNRAKNKETAAPQEQQPNAPASRTFVAIYPNERDHFDIGFALVDFNFSTLVVEQFKDSRNFAILANKIEIADPMQDKTVCIFNYLIDTIIHILTKKKIIIPNSLVPNINPICEFFTENVKDKSKFIAMKTHLFNRQKGFEALDKYCSIDYRNWSQLVSKNCAMASVAGLFRYIETLKEIDLAPKSIRLRLENDENLTIIDSNASKCLELVANAHNSRSSRNLFGLLNSTKTKTGNKSLRANILQPPCNVEMIEQRLDIVESLFGDLQLFSNLLFMLRRFSGLEDLVTFCYQTPRTNFESVKRTDSKIVYVLGMRAILEEAKSLYNLVQKSENNTIKKLFDSFMDEEEFKIIENEIEKIMDPNSFARINEPIFKAHKCFALKTKFDGYLDVCRKAYVETIDSLKDHVQKLCEETELPIKFSYNQSRGYYLVLSVQTDKKRGDRSSSVFSTSSIRLLESLPSSFIKISKNSNSIHFTTTKLIQINERIKHLIDDIYLISDKILNGLLSRLRPHFDCYYKISECLSTLDVHLSLVNYLLTNPSCVRPRFGADVQLERAFHPVLKEIKEGSGKRNDTSVVSADVTIGNTIRIDRRAQFILLTGSNMSGKSTFLKELGNLQVMSQCGSFIPADKAQLIVKKRILTLGGEFTTDSKYSSFERELIELNYILQNLDDDALILVDEFCRNTNYYEGLSIAFAVCDHILKHLQTSKNQSLIVFATHFKELAYLESFYSNMKCCYFESVYDDREKKLNHTYQLKNGVNNAQHYGCELMSINPLPSPIIQDAKRLANIFKENLDDLFKPTQVEKKRRLVMDLYSEIESIAETALQNDEMTDEQLETLERLLLKFEQDYSELAGF